MISAFIAMQGSFTSAKFGSWVRIPTWKDGQLQIAT